MCRQVTGRLVTKVVTCWVKHCGQTIYISIVFVYYMLNNREWRTLMAVMKHPHLIGYFYIISEAMSDIQETLQLPRFKLDVNVNVLVPRVRNVLGKLQYDTGINNCVCGQIQDIATATQLVSIPHRKPV